MIAYGPKKNGVVEMRSLQLLYPKTTLATLWAT